MIGKYLSLQWKSFVRPASFGKSLALKLAMGFLGLMTLLYVLAMSIGSFYILQNQFPGQDLVLVGYSGHTVPPILEHIVPLSKYNFRGSFSLGQLLVLS